MDIFYLVYKHLKMDPNITGESKSVNIKSVDIKVPPEVVEGKKVWTSCAHQSYIIMYQRG